MEDLVIQILLVFIGMISVIVVSYAVPYLKSKTTNEQMKQIEYWTQVAIEVIEDYYKNNPGQGEIKKEFVMDFMKGLGLNITEEQLGLLIDALVKEMNEIKQKKLE